MDTGGLMEGYAPPQTGGAYVVQQGYVPPTGMPAGISAVPLSALHKKGETLDQ